MLRPGKHWLLGQYCEIMLSFLTISPRTKLGTWQDVDWKEMTQKAFVSGVVLVIFYHASALLYSLYLSPLRSVPGPFLARITRWWEYVKVVNGDSHQEYIRLHEKYGSLFPDPMRHLQKKAPNTW